MNNDDINMLRPRRLHGWQPIQVDEKITQSGNKRSFLFYLIPGLIIIFIFTSFSFIRDNRLAGWTNNPDDYNNLTLQPKKKGFLDSLKSFIFKSDDVVEGKKIDRVNILLMGIGGENHDGGYLSDTNIILSLKPSSQEIAMISIPRDMSAKIQGYGWTKINHAHAYGEMDNPGQGGEFARKTFEENLNVDIPYYVTVDFKAFQEIIDAVEGVEIDVPRSFIDYSYPGPNYTYQIVKFTKGVTRMDGEEALKFTRSRHGNNGEGSDFARAYRQQLVLAALKKKMLTAGTYLNPVKIKKIIDSISDNTRTNLDFGQIMYLASLTRDIDETNIKTIVLDNSDDGYLRSFIGYNGAFLLAPKTGSYDAISLAINNIFDPNATSTIPLSEMKIADQTDSPFPAAKIEVQNGTWQAGLASRTKRDLEDIGFSVYTIGNTINRPIATSTIIILNNEIDYGFINALENALEIKSTTTIPNWMYTTTTNFLDSNLSSSTTNDYYDNRSDILVLLGDTSLNTSTSTTSTVDTTTTTIYD